MKRRFILLDAYERFTEKEALCLKESNFKAAHKIQEKKSKLIRELSVLDDLNSIDEAERRDFNQRIEDLERIEAENAQLLDQMQGENRMKARSLSKQVSAVSGIQKAYGSSRGKPMTEGGLKGKA